ncbi:MAG: DUF4091 domain-containing protein [Armatimonadetes bacterium]|nr:DUF4091 domain-containing protein [Armatimonadota bacterium]
MRPALIALALLTAALGYAQPERGANLLVNPGFEQTDGAKASGWGMPGKGYLLSPGQGRDGGTCITCVSDDPEAYFGAMQEVVLDEPINHPFKVSGWSKAENANGRDYCLYMDCWYDDGTNLWGRQKSFTRGTHDWEYIEYVFHPEKPIVKIQYFILFRRCTGQVWFDDVSLSLAPFEVQRKRAVPGLYGGNSIDFSASLSLPAKWKAEVLRAGQPVFESAGEGHAACLNWGGRDASGTLLPGGEYTVRLTATDDLLGKTLTDETPVRTPDGPGMGYVAWTENALVRVLRQDAPEKPSADLTSSISLAGNEYESFQVCLRAAPGRDLKDCEVRISDLTGPRGARIEAKNVEWHQVGFVHLAKLHEHPALPDAMPGWWPDPLLPVPDFDVAGGVTQSLWFTLYAPPGTPAGKYSGTVSVSPGNAQGFDVQVTANVYGFSVPDQPHIKTAFALMDGFLEKLYGPLSPELRRQYGDYVLRHRLNPDDISRTDPPDLDDLEHYDSRGLNAFNVLNMVKHRGKATWVCWSPLEVYTPAFKQSLIDRLDPYVAELKRRGLADKAYVYTFDERGEEFWPVMREYFGMIRERYGIPTLTTAYVPQKPEIMRDLNIDWNCPLTAAYRFEQAEECRAHGLQVWGYVCCGPRHPYANWLADDPLIEARVIWWQVFHQKMDGMLYWGLNIWGRPHNDRPIDPERDGPDLKWSITTGRPGDGWTETLHGDGELLYAGKDGPIGSIRLAAIRDGIEDYEYLYLLAALEGDLEAGREACLPVTTDLTTYTRDPGDVLAQREQIARRIEALMGTHRD